jgi:hypothetical protein
MEAQGELQAGIPDPCVLLGGQPRSGTTLLSSILRCTPGHFQAFELHIRKPSFVAGLEGRYTRNIFRDLDLSADEYDRIVRATDCSQMNLGAWVGPKEDVSAEPLSGRETSNVEGELRARGELTSRLMRRVAQIHDANTWGFKILGDIVYANEFARVWPNAKFILMIRDPRDQAMSVLKLNEQRSARGQQNFYDDYRQAAQGWRDTIEYARAVVAHHNIRCIETRYEDLVSNTDAELSRLSDALGMDLSKGLDFNQREFIDAHTQRFKHHDNLRNTVNAASVGKWRESLSAQDLAAFIEVAGDLMSELNYA